MEDECKAYEGTGLSKQQLALNRFLLAGKDVASLTKYDKRTSRIAHDQKEKAIAALVEAFGECERVKLEWPECPEK